MIAEPMEILTADPTCLLPAGALVLARVAAVD